MAAGWGAPLSAASQGRALRITLRATGGFTGPAGSDERTLDTKSLSGTVAARLSRAIELARLEELPPVLKKLAPQPQDFLYTLVVEDGGASRAIEYHLDAAPEALRRLTSLIEDLT